MSCRERLLKLLSAKGSCASSDIVTTINDGQEVAAPDIVGIWNNQFPGVSAALQNNVVGLISQVGRGEVNLDQHANMGSQSLG